jgi:prepilin-type N-terminal cleavage/methylation domain-containing protein
MKLKLQVASCRLQVFQNVRQRSGATFNLQPSTFNRCRAFTLVEVAISLAIIGIALVAIIGVLPFGMNAQRDNRERTVINQDATIFMEAIRNGARGADDLTNYVYQIDVAGGNSINPPFSGAQIIGYLTKPGVTNHAWVYSISGPAVEKPPQNNQMIQASFSYKIACENMSVESADTNSAYGKQLTSNLHELRLTFYWPLLPNGNLPANPLHQTFRALVAGQVVPTNNLWFFQPQSFQSVTNAP